jgi:predicted phosphohydrolase
VELTKLGPDNKVYAIIRENHEYYIKSTDKVSNIVVKISNILVVYKIKNKKHILHMLKLLNS